MSFAHPLRRGSALDPAGGSAPDSRYRLVLRARHWDPPFASFYYFILFWALLKSFTMIQLKAVILGTVTKKYAVTFESKCKSSTLHLFLRGSRPN